MTLQVRPVKTIRELKTDSAFRCRSHHLANVPSPPAANQGRWIVKRLVDRYASDYRGDAIYWVTAHVSDIACVRIAFATHL
jgi:hypothetical protein